MQSPTAETFSPQQQNSAFQLPESLSSSIFSVPPPVPLFPRNPYQLSNQHRFVDHQHPTSNQHMPALDFIHTSQNMQALSSSLQQQSHYYSGSSPVSTASPNSGSSNPLQSNSSTSSFNQSPMQQHLALIQPNSSYLTSNQQNSQNQALLTDQQNQTHQNLNQRLNNLQQYPHPQLQQQTQFQ